MPAYQLHIYEQQEEREALEQKICEQVDACTEVNGTIRNMVKKFLIEEGNRHFGNGRSLKDPIRRIFGKERNRSCTNYLPEGI